MTCCDASWTPVEDPTLLLIIAYGMRRLPYVTRVAVAGLQQTPRDLEFAAANLGAGSWATLRRIVVSLILENLIAGALFAFSFSILEVSDSLILAQKIKYFPITRAIYELAAILGLGPYLRRLGNDFSGNDNSCRGAIAGTKDGCLVSILTYC